MKNIIICLYGSSIMEGRIGVSNPLDRWYNIFHRLLSENNPKTCFAIVNSAKGGESTREIMQRFDQDILSYNPDYCIFMIGGNNHDCRRPERILRKGELESLAHDFAARLPQKTRVVGAIINPVIDEWHFATKDPAYQDYLAKHDGSLDQCLNPERKFARNFYKQQGWPCLDLYKLMSPAPETYIVKDGVHLSPKGHKFFAQKMFELMNPFFQDEEA